MNPIPFEKQVVEEEERDSMDKSADHMGHQQKLNRRLQEQGQDSPASATIRISVQFQTQSQLTGGQQAAVEMFVGVAVGVLRKFIKVGLLNNRVGVISNEE